MEEVACVEGNRGEAPYLLREVEVHGKGGRDTLRVEIVARVALHDELGQLPVERRVVVSGPGELLGKGDPLVGRLPRGVVFGIDSDVAAPVVERHGGAEVVRGTVEQVAAGRAVAVLAQISAVVVERGFETHGEDHADARDVRDDGHVQVHLLLERAVAHGCRPGVVTDILVGAAVGHRRRGGECRGHLREVQPLVAVVVAVETDARAQGVDLREVGREVDAPALDGRAVRVLRLRDEGVALAVADGLRRLHPGAVQDRHHARLAVDRVDAVGRGNRASGLQVGLRRQLVGEGGVDRPAHVGIHRPVAEEGHGEACAAERGLDTRLLLDGVLPLQVGIPGRGCRLRVVGVEGRAVGRRAGSEGEAVAVRRGRIERLEGGLLDRLAPSDADGKVADQRPAVLPQDVFCVETRRERGDGAVLRAADQRGVGAQPGRQAQQRPSRHGQGQLLLDEERRIVHEGQAVVAVFAPGRGIAHVRIVEPASEVAASRHFAAEQQAAHGLADAAVPVGPHLEGVGQRLRVGPREGVPVARGAQDDVGRGVVVVLFGDVVSGLRRVDVWLCRGAVPVLVRLGELVAVRCRGLYEEVGDPRLVEQPLQLDVAADRIVARPRIALLELVRIGLGVVAAEVARHGGRQPQGTVAAVAERIAVGQVQVVAVVGRMGRGQIADRAGPFDVDVENPGAFRAVAAEQESLAEGHLPGPGLHGHLDEKRRLAPACADLHDAVRQVAVLDRRDARDDLDRLDV